VKRIRGSHHILRHPSIPDAIPVPVHGNQPTKKGTLGNILRTPESVVRTSTGCSDGGWCSIPEVG
jgi:hypothetical protein